MRGKKDSKTELGFLFVIASFVAYLAAVLAINQMSGGFRGLLPTMAKETILMLRTLLAAAALFIFFPLIWTIYQREKRLLLGLILAGSPALFGFALFLLKGAFKTFFAFFILSAFYLLILSPRAGRRSS